MSLVNPFVKHLKDPQAAMAHNRPRPNNGDIQAAAGIFAAQMFAGEFRPPVFLHRCRRRVLGYRVGFRGSIYRG